MAKTNIYLCRWPNGDCSVVAAQDEDDAIFRLDRIGSTAPENLTVLPHFLVNFKLADDGQLVLEDYPSSFGERSWEAIDNEYPILSAARNKIIERSDGTGNLDETTQQAIRQAVTEERERIKKEELLKRPTSERIQ